MTGMEALVWGIRESGPVVRGVGEAVRGEVAAGMLLVRTPAGGWVYGRVT
jgi:hypothetical protein